MNGVIYRTQPFRPYGKSDLFWNEYVQDGDEVTKYVYSKVKFPDRELRNQIYSQEKQRWTIGDINLPDWLYRYVADDDLSDNGKKIVKQWRLEKYSSDLNNYKEKGYFIDEENKIVITDHEILMFREDSEVPYWDKITSLVKEAYNRSRISVKFMELVKNDIERDGFNYEIIQSMAENNREKNKEIELKEKEKKEKDEIEGYGILFKKLRKNLVDIRFELSQVTREEIDFLIDLIDESEISRTSYHYLYKEAQEIILKEKSKRD